MRLWTEASYSLEEICFAWLLWLIFCFHIECCCEQSVNSCLRDVGACRRVFDSKYDSVAQNPKKIKIIQIS